MSLLTQVCSPSVEPCRDPSGVDPLRMDDVDEFIMDRVHSESQQYGLWSKRFDSIDLQLKMLQASLEGLPDRFSLALDRLPLQAQQATEAVTSPSSARTRRSLMPIERFSRRGSRLVPAEVHRSQAGGRNSLPSNRSRGSISSPGMAPPPGHYVSAPAISAAGGGPEPRQSLISQTQQGLRRPTPDSDRVQSLLEGPVLTPKGAEGMVSLEALEAAQRRNSVLTSDGEKRSQAGASEGDFPASVTGSTLDAATAAHYQLRGSQFQAQQQQRLKDGGAAFELMPDSAEEVARSATLCAGHSLVELEEDRPRFILLPGSYPRLGFDAVLSFALIYAVLVCPVAVSYFDTEEVMLGINGILLQMVDAVFFLDLIFNFRTGFFDFRTGDVILDPRRITHHYLTTWLCLDVLTIWPITFTPSSLLSWVFALKVLRIPRLHSLVLRLQKVFRLNWLRRVALAVSVLLTTHVLACIWRLSLQRDNRPAPPHNNWWDLYVMDAYWVTMTMTTIGYGDIAPEGTSSRVYAMSAMLMASFCFAAVVSTLTHTMKGVFEDETEMLVKDTRNFMQRRGVPEELQRRAEQSLRHHFIQEKRTTLDPKVFASLSPNIQRELSLALLSNTVLQFPLFRGALHSFVAELAQAHLWVLCVPGDLVAEEGQLISDVVFLVQGRLIAQSRSRGDDTAFDMDFEDGYESTARTENGGTRSYREQMRPQETVMDAPAWFGEACLFGLSRVFAATITAVVDSELAVLPAMEYLRIVHKYPRLLERQRTIERQVKEKEVNLSVLDYRVATAQFARGGSQASKHSRTLLRRQGTLREDDADHVGRNRLSSIDDPEAYASVNKEGLPSFDRAASDIE